VIGCGFVADLYLSSLKTFPGVRVLAVHDRDAGRQAAFCAHWGVPGATLDQALALDGLVLNLTNPDQHAAVTRAALLAGRHVWSEKPLTTLWGDAVALHDLARSRGLILASAPSSVLSRAGQTLVAAIRNGTGGTARLIYAELDDGFIPQAPVGDWTSASGAPWPYADEFRTGCTLEHAGYWLSWLIAALGPVARVDSAVAQLLEAPLGVRPTAPDLSVALIHFAAGPVARLTCSILAPHDHRLRVITDDGVIEVAEAWDNQAQVRFRRRIRLRRRLLESPLARRLPAPPGAGAPPVPRTGAAAMNFALGPVEVLAAIRAGRPSRLGGDYALHLTEVTLAAQAGGGPRPMTTTCAPMEPVTWPLAI
jgi:predicted dehydrogenase